MSKQPEALRLADDLDSTSPSENTSWLAAAELRRLHAVNVELLEAMRGLLNALPSATTHPAIAKARAAITKAEAE